MSDFNSARWGQDNGVGGTDSLDRALFLKKYGGEVLKEFLDSTQMLDKTFKKTITQGKSASFPYTSNVTANYHNPGQELLGQGVLNSEKIINLDRLLVTDIHINKIDELMSHWDNRRPYVEAMGNALSVAMDRHIMIEALNGARSPEVVAGSGKDGFIYGDTALTVPTSGADEADFVQAFMYALEQCAVNLSKKNVPDSLKRYVVVSPEAYYALSNAVLANGFSLFNKDYNGAGGSFGTSSVPMIHGFEVIKSNHLPNTNIVATGIDEYHSGDFSNTVGLAFCQDAVGTLVLQDLKVENDPYQARYKGELLTADYAVGHSWLRPECLMELRNVIV